VEILEEGDSEVEGRVSVCTWICWIVFTGMLGGWVRLCVLLGAFRTGKNLVMLCVFAF
jgi:hypothetical protein